MSFNCKKIARYVRNDDLEKAKKQIKISGLHAIEMPLDRKKRTAIHLACKHRSSYCLQYFLRSKVDLGVIDRDGNLPIHLVFNKGRCSKRDYVDVLQPLLLKCSSFILDTPNNKGITPRELFKINKIKNIKNYFNRTCDNQEDIETPKDEFHFNEEDVWQEKLRSYADEDYENDFGKFEKDESDDYSNNETYDQWANRISEEYSRKNHQATHSTKIKNRKIDRNKTSENEKWKLKENSYLKPSSNSLAKTMKFITKTKSLFSKTETSAIYLQDLPWIKYSEEKILDILLCGIDRSDINLTKKTLKGHLIQWHPDKFSQMCSHRLVEKDKIEILSAVNNFAQIINEAIQKLK